jgi:uncharacterized protein DUF5916
MMLLSRGADPMQRYRFGLVACLTIAVACLVRPSLACAADPPSFAVAVSRADSSPKIDGTLNDPLWKKATHIQMTWDYQFRRPASEPTDVYLLADKTSLYVAFVAKQSEPITATDHTNDSSLSADDAVRVYLWPSGENGFEYFFAANPIGTRNEYSGENSSFAPHWTAVASRTADGYIVTEQIPMNVMRGDGRSTWRLQFDRTLHVTGQTFEWAHDGAQRSTDSVSFTGFLTGMNVATGSTRTKPRVGLYTLGQVGSAGANGNRARVGADIALPITDTASFFSSLYPDYSNVDQDQQTISPTAFSRQYTEVRPFFTQGLNFYNNFNCNDCYDVPFLYTPSIPTPQQGYAVEGLQGQAQFAGFDALGVDGRSDNAQTLIYTTANRDDILNVLRFATLAPGLSDTTSIYQLTVGNHHNFSVYATTGGENGTDITAPTLGHYNEWGLNLFSQKSGFFPAYHDIGPEYGPPDGLAQISDIHGPTLYVTHEFDNAPTSFIQSYTLSQDVEHFKNSEGALHLADAFTSLTINTKTQYTLAATTGYQYLLLSNNYGSMVDQNGVALSHGSQTSTPTTISYNVGRFGPGYLRTTTRLTTLRMTQRGTLALEADNTNDTTDEIPSLTLPSVKNVQWLERATFTYQFNSSSALAVGLRRIIGTSPELLFPTTTCRETPLTAACGYTDASNVSVAFHKRVGADELYVVYGDPNQLATLPALIVKFVHYFGADKGT